MASSAMQVTKVSYKIYSYTQEKYVSNGLVGAQKIGTGTETHAQHRLARPIPGLPQVIPRIVL